MAIAKNTTTENVEYKEEIVVIMPVLEKEGEYAPLPKEQRDNTRRISSQFKVIDGQITPNIIKGLTREQEKIFLSEQLGINADSPTWENEIKKYWAEYTVKIPIAGIRVNKAVYQREVNINGAKVVIDYPYNLSDYIMYNFVMESKDVAKTPEQKENMDLYKAYVEDYSILKAKEFSLLAEKDKADNNYVNLINDKNAENKINWIVERFRQPEENFMSFSLADKKLKLREIKDKEPLAFNEQFENPNLEQEAFLYQLLTVGILKKEGKLYFNGVENLGSKAEAIEYMKNSTNSENILKFKALLEQKIKEHRNIK